jgi:hypothetical protein
MSRIKKRIPPQRPVSQPADAAQINAQKAKPAPPVPTPAGGDPDGAPADISGKPEVVGQNVSQDNGAAGRAQGFAPSQSGVGGAGVMPFQVQGRLKDAPMNHKSPPTAAVQALADQYGVSERLGRPRERILGWAAKIQDGLVGVDEPGKLLDQVVGNDLRLQIFYMEGILKLYRKRYPDELTGMFGKVKALEDALGLYSATMAHTRLGEEKGVSPEMQSLFKKHEADARTAMLDRLATDGWLPEGPDKKDVPLMRELTLTLAGMEWDSYEDDKAFVKDEIGDEIRDLQKADLNMDELQGDVGLHELRRQLRWIPIYATSLDGLVIHTPDKNPVKFYEPLLQSDVASSKYAKLPEATRESDPIVVPTSLYLANTKYITDVGKLKDRGEEIEAIEHALVELGEAKSPKKARKEALEILGLPKDGHDAIHEEAHALYDEMKDNKFFKALRRTFHPK